MQALIGFSNKFQIFIRRRRDQCRSRRLRHPGQSSGWARSSGQVHLAIGCDLRSCSVGYNSTHRPLNLCPRDSFKFPTRPHFQFVSRREFRLEPPPGRIRAPATLAKVTQRGHLSRNSSTAPSRRHSVTSRACLTHGVCERVSLRELLLKCSSSRESNSVWPSGK